MNMTIEECTACPRSCKAYRGEHEGEGFCRAGMLPKVARIAPHYWEEPCLSGKNGSGAVFFSGCTLRCVYCQNYKISAQGFGREMTPKELAESYRRLEEQGVHNINLVSASHYIDAALESLTIYRPQVPVVYNCSGYESVESLKRLEGYVDIYLPDFKYADDEKALRYSSAPGYRNTALHAVKEMVRQTGKPRFDENGMLQSGVLVRHLVLPMNTRNSIAVLELLAEKFGSEILVSLMAQYVPCGQAEKFPEINRKITAREFQKVSNRLFELGLDGFVQELKAADKGYIPDFDLTGIK